MVGKAYFIFGSSYARYDGSGDVVDTGYPKPINGNWKGFAEAGFEKDIDAAIDWGNDKVFFFKGADYIRYSIGANAVDPDYPRVIAGAWPGMAEAGFGDNIDAALNLGSGKAYFFRGSQYLRYDVAGDAVDPGYPLPIADGWAGLADAGMSDGIDAAIAWDAETAYFFKGDQYVRYEIGADRTADGYPKSVDENWPGLGVARAGQPLAAIWSKAGGGAQPGPAGSGSHNVDISHLSDTFFSELKAVAARLQCSAEDMLAVMLSESGVQPWAHNKTGDASGIIQFMPAVLKKCGWTQGHEAFRQLSAEDQLPYVERFYASNSGRLTSAGRIYQATFLPATMPDSDEDTVLVEPDGRYAQYWEDNRALDTNKDGKITVSDLTARIARVRSYAVWPVLLARLNV